MFSQLIRRNFVKLVSLGTASAVLAACTSDQTNDVESDNSTTSSTEYTLKIQSTWSAKDIFQEISGSRHRVSLLELRTQPCQGRPKPHRYCLPRMGKCLDKYR